MGPKWQNHEMNSQCDLFGVMQYWVLEKPQKRYGLCCYKSTLNYRLGSGCRREVIWVGQRQLLKDKLGNNIHSQAFTYVLSLVLEEVRKLLALNFSQRCKLINIINVFWILFSGREWFIVTKAGTCKELEWQFWARYRIPECKLFTNYLDIVFVLYLFPWYFVSDCSFACFMGNF